MQILRILALAGMLGAALPASGQSAAELLQKGIYTQETVGDLDAAIRIYQQVVSLGADARSQAAQAQYRLGVCLMRKGSAAEATKAFEKLIADYPEQKELVTAAREQMPAGLKLLPAPWTEGETLKMKLKLPTGMTVGAWIQAIEKSSGGTLVVTTRTHAGGGNQFSRMKADLESMRSHSTVFRHNMLGESEIAYDGRQARVRANGKDLKPTVLSPMTFDNEAVLPMLRRLPLAEGYKTQFDITHLLTGGLVQLTVEVTAIEDVATAAGKFRAFKVEIQPIRQTFWVSDDSHRYLVKMEVNGAIGELDEITRIDNGLTTFRDEAQNVSIAVTAPWMVLRADATEGKDFTNALIMDSEARCQCILWAGKIERDLRTDMEEKVKGRPKTLKGYTVRPDSWRTRIINGQEAISVLADFEQNKVAMVEYLTILKKDTKGMVLFARVPATDLATIQPPFEKIIESARLQ